MSVFAIALTFFLVANPVGNSPAIIALIKDFDFARQRMIVLREAIFALLLALFFQYFGEVFLSSLNIQGYAVTITGGLLLFIVALSMIFAVPANDAQQAKTEPFFVPIATPIITGPGLLATIMIFAKQESNDIKITSAILIAWIGVGGVMLAAPYLQRILGKRGLVALEQLMGLVLALISVEMVVKGSALLYKTL